MNRKRQVKRALQRDLLIIGSASLTGLLSLILFAVFDTISPIGVAYPPAPYSMPHFVMLFWYFGIGATLGYLFSYFGMVVWPYDDSVFAGIRPQHRIRVIIRSQLAIIFGHLIFFGGIYSLGRLTYLRGSDVEIYMYISVYMLSILLAFTLLNWFKYFNPQKAMK